MTSISTASPGSSPATWVWKLPRFFLLTLVSALGACAHHNPACEHVQPGAYFPAGAFRSDANLDANIHRWYGGELCRMSEAPLAAQTADETYRFLWLRAFQPPVSVRIQRAGGRATLVAVELDEHGNVSLRRERTLGDLEWRTLTATLGTAAFWDAPTRHSDVGGEDGADWIFEGYRPGLYHVIWLWSPERGPFRAAGEALLQAAQLSFPADQRY
jgi:hypothetical protein